MLHKSRQLIALALIITGGGCAQVATNKAATPLSASHQHNTDSGGPVSAFDVPMNNIYFIVSGQTLASAYRNVPGIPNGASIPKTEAELKIQTAAVNNYVMFLATKKTGAYIDDQINTEFKADINTPTKKSTGSMKLYDLLQWSATTLDKGLRAMYNPKHDYAKDFLAGLNPSEKRTEKPRRAKS